MPGSAARPPAADWRRGRLGLWAACVDGGRVERLDPAGVTVRPDGDATLRYAATVAWADGRRDARVARRHHRRPHPRRGHPRRRSRTGTRSPSASGAGRTTRRCPRWTGRRRAARVTDRLAALGCTPSTAPLRLRSYRPGPPRRVQAASAADLPQDRAPRRRRPARGPAPAPRRRRPGGAGARGHRRRRPRAARPARGVAARGAGRPAATGCPVRRRSTPARRAAGCRDPARRRHSAPGGGALARVDDHAAVLGAVSPAAATAARGAGRRPRRAPIPATIPVVPVHGDFYESQLLVARGAVVGLLDVDTVGPGAPHRRLGHPARAPGAARAPPARARRGRPRLPAGGGARTCGTAGPRPSCGPGWPPSCWVWRRGRSACSRRTGRRAPRRASSLAEEWAAA